MRDFPFRPFVFVLVALAAGAVAVACGSASSSSTTAGGSTRLTLVAYSTPKEAYAKLIPAFAKTAAGAKVAFDQSYGASGEQSRAVDGGLPADLVAFSLEPDMTRLVNDHKVAADWNARPDKGMVTDSVVVFVVRKGNPKHVQTWDDLVKSGVEVVTPNPFTSGGARWNLMAAYGAKVKAAGQSPQQGLDFLKRLLQHTPVQSASAREALQVFTGGKGDVMLAYENEARLAQQKGEQIDVVVPDQTILIENPAAVTSDSAHPVQAKAFLDFLHTPAAQRIFGQQGYRPVDANVAKEFSFPQPKQLFTIDDLGGWKTVKDSFFDPAKGSVAKIEQGLGVPTNA